MKNIIFVVVALCINLCVQAQSIVIKLSNGEEVRYYYHNIEKINISSKGGNENGESENTSIQGIPVWQFIGKKVFSAQQHKELNISLKSDLSLETNDCSGMLDKIQVTEESSKKIEIRYFSDEVEYEDDALEKIILPESIEIKVNQSLILTPVFVPENAFCDVTWSSDDESIATVDEITGEVTGISIGTTIIYCVSNDAEHLASCQVTVLPDEDSNVEEYPTDISQMDNVIYIDDTEGIANGRMTFYVKMKNSVVAKGFTFNLGIPEGFSVAKNLDGKIDVSLYKTEGRIDADSNVEFEGYFVSDGSLYVNAYVNGMDAFKKHDGAMLRIRLLIPKDTPVGSYPITISNWSISDDGGDTWPKGERPSLTFPLVVAEKVRGDANGDAKDKTKEASENVDVNSADFVKIVNFIFGLPHEGLDKTAADANGDGVVNATDLTVIADMKRKAAASSRAVKENVPTEAE